MKKLLADDGFFVRVSFLIGIGAFTMVWANASNAHADERQRRRSPAMRNESAIIAICDPVSSATSAPVPSPVPSSTVTPAPVPSSVASALPSPAPTPSAIASVTPGPVVPPGPSVLAFMANEANSSTESLSGSSNDASGDSSPTYRVVLTTVRGARGMISVNTYYIHTPSGLTPQAGHASAQIQGSEDSAGNFDVKSTDSSPAHFELTISAKPNDWGRHEATLVTDDLFGGQTLSNIAYSCRVAR